MRWGRSATAGATGGDASPGAARRGALRVEQAIVRFGDRTVLDRLDFAIPAGARLALLGPSGCGKTTLLRLLAGLETASQGRVLLDGDALDALQPWSRPVNMMFQSYALFPHLDVGANVAFGLRREGLGRAEAARRAARALADVQLEGFGPRRVDTLSGGQRQRVALARALVKRPRMLLLDEPLSALDRRLREDTGAFLVRLQEALGTTFVTVTHDQEEAMAVATLVAVMAHGRILQLDTPETVWERPASRAVASFIGGANLLDGTIERVDGSVARLRCPGAGATLGVPVPPGSALSPGDRRTLVIHPARVAARAPDAPGDGDRGGDVNRVPARLTASAYRGGRHDVDLALVGGATLRVRQDGGPMPAGDAVLACWDVAAGWLVVD